MKSLPKETYDLKSKRRAKKWVNQSEKSYK